MGKLSTLCVMIALFLNCKCLEAETEKKSGQKVSSTRQQELEYFEEEFKKLLNSEEFSNNDLEEDLALFQNRLRRELITINNSNGLNNPLNKNQCLSSPKEDPLQMQDPSLFVFISFSVSEITWVKLSTELVQTGGVFVLQGLPNQSFQELSTRSLKLKELGVDAPIHLDPLKFHEFAINKVPAFVVSEEGKFDKLSGNVSLNFALEEMSQKGETKAAQTLFAQLKAKS